jgi:hypothetical protein
MFNSFNSTNSQNPVQPQPQSNPSQSTTSSTTPTQSYIPIYPFFQNQNMNNMTNVPLVNYNNDVLSRIEQIRQNIVQINSKVTHTDYGISKLITNQMTMMEKYIKLLESNSNQNQKIKNMEDKIKTLEKKIDEGQSKINNPFLFNFKQEKDNDGSNESSSDDDDRKTIKHKNWKKSKQNIQNVNKLPNRKFNFNNKKKDDVTQSEKKTEKKSEKKDDSSIFKMPFFPPSSDGIVIKVIDDSMFNPFEKLFGSLGKKLGSDTKSKKDSYDMDSSDNEVGEPYDEEDNNKQVEDIGIKIKTIDDLIEIGNIYPKLKDLSDNKNSKIKESNDKEKEHDTKEKEPIKETDMESLARSILGKLVGNDKTAISKMIDGKKVEELDKEKKNEKKISRLYELGGKYYPINLETLHKLVKPMTKLKNMIGLTKVKDSILDMVLYYLQKFETSNKNMLHTVIEGPPGVGKTKLGKIIAEIYAAMGIIPSAKFKLVKRTDLIGEYLGHTAHRTQKAIDEADGGVLFIDEAYSLGAQDGGDSFSKEAIDTLNQNLSEKKKNFICIIAGYPDELEKSFFSYNPGLSRRFPFRYKIESYTSEEMTKIMVKKVNDMNWKFNESNLTEKVVEKFFKDNKDYFPNYGGDIDNLLVQCKFCHSRRVVGQPPKVRCIFSIEDLNNGFERFKSHKSKDTEKQKHMKEIASLMFS